MAGAKLAHHARVLPKDGKLAGTLRVGDMTDGACYAIVAAIRDQDGKAISTKTETFTRKVMPFETAAKAGIADLVPAPFTPPVIRDQTVACIGRIYRHGAAGLLESLVAAGKELLAAPAALKVKVGDGPAVSLVGDTPRLTARGIGMVAYQQVFAGSGLKMEVTGDFDYDGFYRFSVRLAPGAGPVDLSQCYLELPLREASATLMEAPVEWMWKDGEKCTGFLAAAARPSVGLQTLSLRRARAQGQHAAVLLGRATTIAASVSPAHRTRACTTTMPCPPPRSIAKAGRSSFAPGSSTSR